MLGGCSNRQWRVTEDMGEAQVHGGRRFFRTGHAHQDIAALLSKVEPKGRCLDLPVGAGVNIDGIRQAGFEPVAGDLFPEKTAEKGVECASVDFNELLPFEDASFEAVLCSEGIEHCERQWQLIREFGRILKPGGSLLITTPNILNLRARLANMTSGNASFKRLPISEVTQVRGRGEDGRLYVGHVFLTSYHVLRFMLAMSGFGEFRVSTAKYSRGSALLAPLLWLPVRLGARHVEKQIAAEGHPEVGREIREHTMSPTLLYGKKLMLLARKLDQ
jgi:SAM-dependent methyltransferase